MRLIYLLFLLPVMAFSQNFSLEVGESYCEGLSTDAVVQNPINIINHTDETLLMRWVRTDMDYPEGWAHSHCDPEGCNPQGMGKRDFNLDPDGGSTGYINVHFHPNGIAGEGWVQVRVFEIADEANDVFVTFNATIDAVTGLYNLNAQNLAYLSQNYPNPCNGSTTINYELTDNDNVSLQLTDVSGRVVYSQTVNGLKGTIVLDDLATGVYQYSLVNDAVVLASKQLVVR